MTTLQTQQRTPHFGVPLSGDPMEVTTDMDRHFEASEDIDIDLDLTGDTQQDEGDEHMDEDYGETIDTAPIGEQDSHAANDDEMADGGYAEGSIAGGSSVHDEDLEDADILEPRIGEDAIVYVAVENASDPSSDLLDNGGDIDASEPHDNNHIDQEYQVNHYPDQEHREQREVYEGDLDATVGTLSDGQKEAPNISHGKYGLLDQEPSLKEPSLKDYEEHTERQQSGLAPSQDEPDSAVHQPSQEEHDEYYSKPDEFQHPGVEETVGTPSRELEHATNPRTEQVVAASAREELAPSSNIDPEMYPQNLLAASGGESTTELIHVLPVVMVYQDTEISLFPSNSQGEDEKAKERSSTYFLEDEQLVNDSIQNLLRALRSVLGASISEQDELIIDIEELGLRISEFSTDLSTTSLSEVIDIYVQLQHYDGLNSPPPLYMNLVTKARFSRRLESLLSVIAEGKGLSQTRSSYTVEERQQPEAEGVSGPDVGDELLQAGVLHDRGVEASVSSQGEDAGSNHGDETARNDSELSSSLLDRSKPVSPALEAIASAVNLKRGNDETSADTTNCGNVAIMADGQHSEVSRTDLTEWSPQLTPPTESERHILEEAIVDDDDFIDYEDNGYPAHVTSSGSSTLQGDVLDVNAEEIDAKSKSNISQNQSAEFQGTGNIRRRSANEDKVTNDTLNDGVNDSVTEAGEQGESDNVDDASEYLEYSEEENNAPSSDGQIKYAEKSRDIEQSSEPKNHDNPPARNTNDNQNEESKQPQPKSAPLHAKVFQLQGNLVNDAHDDLEGAQSDNEQEHGYQSNTNRRDDETTGALLHNDEYRGDTDDDDEITKLARPGVPPLVVNGDDVDDVPSIGKTEPRLSLDGRSHLQDDDDEITYEDEDEDEEDEELTPMESFPAERKSALSPGSHKRARILDEDNGAIGNDLLDFKRIRSV